MTTAILSEPKTVSFLASVPAAAEAIDITDEQVMAMIQNREDEGIGILHDRYARLLKALIMKVLHNEAESDDLLQEVYMEIWNRAAGYSQEKGKALSWIVTLARRRAIDRLRKREAYCRMEDRLLVETQQNPQDSIHHVEEDVEHAEMREHLNRVLATLPAAQREAIEMAYYRGMSQRDIAGATGIPLGTIKTRLELGNEEANGSASGLRGSALEPMAATTLNNSKSVADGELYGIPAPGLRLLVVDDEPVVREILNLILTDEGHHVVLAKDGDEALAKFAQGTWDVILTDRCMPGLSGDDLAEEIKKRQAALPIIMITGYAGPMEHFGVHHKSIDLVLTKPFTLADIRRGLAKVLGVRPAL